MATLTERRYITLTFVFVLSLAAARHAASQTADDLTAVEVRDGMCAFDVATNVPVLTVHGKSSALQARVRVRRGTEGPLLEQIEAVVPVKSLGTGMRLRDEHMRKYIFTTNDGQVPDVRFVAQKAACAKASGNQSTCELTGDLTIRGTARPFTIALRVIEEKGTFRASGDSVVKLSTYGIDKPSQLGVTTSDEVKLRLEFTARQAGPAAVATNGVLK
jgi:polyisoprenoid-binding protein YceI